MLMVERMRRRISLGIAIVFGFYCFPEWRTFSETKIRIPFFAGE
jgi:hypothetical protein